MKEYVCMILVVSALVAGAFAQTTNNQYEVTFFGEPPRGEEVWNGPLSVAADGKGSILVVRAAQPPVLIFNRAGQLQRTWGNGMFPDPHGIKVDRDGFVWITDGQDQMVYKYTMDGRQLLTLGTKGVTGDSKSTNAFNGPTDVAIARNGDIWVSDGDGNNRVVQFSKDGKFIGIIGDAEGSQPGQFNSPHAIAIDSRDRVLVLDEGNARIQVFDQSGRFVEQWTDVGGRAPNGLAIAPDDTVYVGDTNINSIAVLRNGRPVELIGRLQGRPHHITFDPGTGVVYLADPVTQMLATNVPPNAPRGGFIKQVRKK